MIERRRIPAGSGSWIVSLLLFTLAAWMLLMLAGCSSGTSIRTPAPVTVRTAPSVSSDAGDVSLSPSDIRLTLKVKSKQCFGSAGCNVTVSPDVSLLKDPGDDRVYEITFLVYGDESGPVTQSVTLTGHRLDYGDIFLSTPRSSVKITGKVTGVEQWAY